MSVVNDMLRDLDKRQAPERSEEFTGQAVQESMIEPQKKYSVITVLLVVALCVAILIASSWFFSTRETRLSEDPVNIENPVNIESAKPLVNLVDTQIDVIKEDDSLIGRSVKNRVDEVIDKERLVDAAVVEKKYVENTITKQKAVKQKVAKQAPAQPAKIDKKAASAARDSSNSSKIKPVELKQAEKQNKVSLAAPTLNSDVHKPPEVLPSKEDVVSTKILQLSPKALDQQSAEQTETLFSKGEARQAYRRLYDFIALHDVDSQSRTVLAGHLVLDNRLAEAGDVLVSSQTEANPELRQIKARWLEAKGEHKLALYTLSSNQPDIAEYPAYYELMASYYQRFGYSKKAQLTYTQLVELNDGVANWWAGLAISSDQEKQWESARFAYQQALELPGLNPKLVDFVKSRLTNLNQN